MANPISQYQTRAAIQYDERPERVYDPMLYLIEISLMLAVGARAPEFTLPDQDGRDTSLTTLLNHGPLVLFFYPADFTPGCTKEVCMMRDLHSELLARGLVVAGISPQGAQSHRGFRAKHNLPFRLLSDPGKAVVAMYEVMGPLGFGVRRATYLIDPSRHVRDAVLADFRIARHEDFVRRAMALNSSHTHS